MDSRYKAFIGFKHWPGLLGEKCQCLLLIIVVSQAVDLGDGAAVPLIGVRRIIGTGH